VPVGGQEFGFGKGLHKGGAGKGLRRLWQVTGKRKADDQRTAIGAQMIGPQEPQAMREASHQMPGGHPSRPDQKFYRPPGMTRCPKHRRGLGQGRIKADLVKRVDRQGHYRRPGPKHAALHKA